MKMRNNITVRIVARYWGEAWRFRGERRGPFNSQLTLSGAGRAVTDVSPVVLSEPSAGS